MKSPEVNAAYEAARPYVEGMRQVTERTGMPPLGSVGLVPSGAYVRLNMLTEGIIKGAVSFVILKSDDGIPYLGIGSIAPGGTTGVPLFTRLDFMGAAEVTDTGVTLNASPAADIAVGIMVSLIVSTNHLAAAGNGDLWVFALDADPDECAPSTLPIATMSQNFKAEAVKVVDVVGYQEFAAEVRERWAKFMGHITQLSELARVPSQASLIN